jgi:hypothetical protein
MDARDKPLNTDNVASDSAAMPGALSSTGRTLHALEKQKLGYCQRIPFRTKDGTVIFFEEPITRAQPAPTVRLRGYCHLGNGGARKAARLRKNVALRNAQHSQALYGQSTMPCHADANAWYRRAIEITERLPLAVRERHRTFGEIVQDVECTEEVRQALKTHIEAAEKSDWYRQYLAEKDLFTKEMDVLADRLTASIPPAIPSDDTPMEKAQAAEQAAVPVSPRF